MFQGELNGIEKTIHAYKYKSLEEFLVFPYIIALIDY